MIRALNLNLSRLCLLRQFLAIFAVFILSVSTASAAQIEIQFFGLDLQYDDSAGSFDVYDAGDHAGGNLDSTEADPLQSVGFYLDDSLVGDVHTEEIYLDFLVEDILIPVNNTFSTSAGNSTDFGLDIWSEKAGEEWSLQLAVDTVSVFHANSGIFISLGGVVDGIVGQDLPSDLLIDDEFAITMVLSSASVNIVSENATQVTELNASGIGNIEGTLDSGIIPEPSSIVLALLSCLGLIGYGVRKKYSS